LRAEVLSVGTELLLGHVIDTNAAYLASKLSELGIDLYFKTTVGDNRERLAQALRIARDRADLLLCTGGLGPTSDDITAAVIAEVFGEDLVLDVESVARIEAWLRQRGHPVLDSHRKQAQRPRAACSLPNLAGTAPGLLLDKEGAVVVALPGVPHEMRAMYEASVRPYLLSRRGAPAVILSRRLLFTGIGESLLEDRLRDLMEQANPTLAPLAGLGVVELRITAKAPDAETAGRQMDAVEAEIRARAGEHLVGVDAGSLEEIVAETLTARGLTVAVAESCTGGLVGEMLTRLPGSSAYMLLDVVAYSDEAKAGLLDVSEELLKAHGAVSAETAAAMAAGVRGRAGADLALSITGIAGPSGGTPEKPVGLVYIGVASRLGVTAERYLFGGDRAAVRSRAAMTALDLLRRTAVQLVLPVAQPPSAVRTGEGACAT